MFVVVVVDDPLKICVIVYSVASQFGLTCTAADTSDMPLFFTRWHRPTALS